MNAKGMNAKGMNAKDKQIIRQMWVHVDQLIKLHGQLTPETQAIESSEGVPWFDDLCAFTQAIPLKNEE